MSTQHTGIFSVNKICKKLFGGLTLALGMAVLPAQAQAPAKGWEQDWNKTVAAAKKEGQLIISGPSGRAWRDSLMTFQEAYPEIKVKITPAASTDFWPRLVMEREVGQYLWDLRVGGPDALSFDLKAKGVLAPVRNLLVLPEVADGSKWHGGIDKLFLDNDKRYFLGFAMYGQSIGYYNSKTIPGPLTVTDLIDPKWKGKISMADPRGGSMNNSLAIFYRKYGKEFVQKFLEQKPVVASQWRQQMDWMRTGRQPIALGLPVTAFVESAERGVPVDHYEKLSANAWSQGVGGIQLIDKAPHPNAAKVFINWLLTREVQDRVMKAANLNSRRKDVAIHNPEEAINTQKLDDYIGSQEEAMMPYRTKVKELLTEMRFEH